MILVGYSVYWLVVLIGLSFNWLVEEHYSLWMLQGRCVIFCYYTHYKLMKQPNGNTKHWNRNNELHMTTTLERTAEEDKPVETRLNVYSPVPS
jgi:hypothetical protein